MPTALCVTAPLILAAVLVVSALGKLHAPGRARAALTAMGMPPWLDRPVVARAHPWAEIGLAILMLVVAGPLGVVIAGATLLLMLVYLVLVVRALRSPIDVDCACFGSLGGERVTVGTVWRNAWLAVLAGLTVTCALEGTAVVYRLVSLDASGTWWLGSVLAGALSVALILGTPRTGPPGVRSELLTDEAELGEYARTRTPAIPLILGDGGATDLRRLSAQRAQLIVYVSEGCQSCHDVITALPRWQQEMPQLDVRMMVGAAPEDSSLTAVAPPLTTHDPQLWVWETFGLRGTPSALLLGADGLLAGGPVVGSVAVADFVAEIREQLDA